MNELMLVPPIAFIIILLFSFLSSYVFSFIAFRSQNKTEGKDMPYACGENNYNHFAQPDYSAFFPFAFFFTIAHVAAMIMTTVPHINMQSFLLVGLYIIGAITGLYILLRS